MPRTRFGNWIFAGGGDPLAARKAGVPVARVKTILFMLTALAATLVAIITTLNAGSADASRGLSKEFEAIIAAVIGGCLLTGGYGSALGVRQTSMVLNDVDQVRSKGLGVIFITHNARHALAVGDSFTVLNRGRTLGTRGRGDIALNELQTLMAGGTELVIDASGQAGES